MIRFDPMVPLARGVSLVEASAGTGKTWNIANLFVRLVAEAGLSVDQILVVTFTVAATEELRDRVRGRLAAAVAVLEGADPGGDAVLGALAAGDVEERRLRLRQALEDFDAAAISTIHGFCQRMLQLHAFEADAAFDLELVTDLRPLLEEIVDDHLSATLCDADDETCAFLVERCGLRRDALLALADRAVSAHGAPVRPEPADWRAGRAVWLAEVEAFRAAWRSGRQELLAALDATCAAKQLDGRRYNATKSRNYADRLDAWLAGGAEPSRKALDETWAVYFDPERVAESAKGPALSHPVLDAWARVRRADLGFLRLPAASFVAWVRGEVDRRLEHRRWQSFDDLLRRLADRLGDEAAGPALAAALQARFGAALIDEFQDTDATQWAIFERAFGRGETYLYLIGDPKQAIYAFRGADVFVYERAREAAAPERRFTMTVNHRSDGRYVQAMNALFDRPGLFDLEFVEYVPVEARHRDDRVRLPGGAAPLRLRLLDAIDQKGAATRRVISEVADEAVALLSGGAEIDAGGWRALAPGDLAVLVRSNRQALDVQRALRARGVPAVVASAGSVLASEEALWVQRWLEAVDDPGSESAARLLAATPPFGYTARELQAAGDAESDAWAAWRARIAAWAHALPFRGLAATFDGCLEELAVLERLLALDAGERHVTNLRHVIELVHAASSEHRLGTAGLLHWLRARRHRGDLAGDAAELRLESDADAVQVVTLHRSKGLQYPVVLLPFLWDGALLRAGDRDALEYHDPALGHALVLDLRAGDDPAKAGALEAAAREVLQESLRLLYVGFTRARHAAIAWWGPIKGAETSALGVVLHGAGGIGGAAARVAAGRSDPRVLRADLDALVAASAGTAAWAERGAPRGAAWRPTEAAPEALEARVYPLRPLDRVWRRTSYSGLVHGISEPLGPERPPDEPDDVSEALGDVPLLDLPRGTEAGTWVHGVLEVLDFETCTERGTGRALEALAGDLGRRAGFTDPAHAALLARHLPDVLATPLGPAAGGAALRDVAACDRLDELAFDLPLAGGNDWRPGADGAGGVSAACVAEAMALRADPPWAPSYVDALGAELAQTRLAGFLTGSIDLALRVAVDGRRRWFVVDYKTNLLGPWVDGRRRSTVNDYAPDGLRAEMARHHYFVQYHLYLVALHRFLAFRLADYDYDRDVGGAAYLFLRGMVGPSAPRGPDGAPYGVFVDRPPREVIEGLSRRLGGAP